MDRRVFIQSGMLAAAPAVSTTQPRELTVSQIQDAFQAGRLTSRALAESYLARIHAIDKQGPAINAIIELNPEALSIAAAMDAERKSKGSRGPLHGVPVLIKDNIDTADRMKTSAGSLALAESIAQRDAPLVVRLRAAGAVILGKTNLSEWANFRSTHSVSGWSGRGGQTLNPYALDRNPSGSSSGSGAAVAANLCAVAVGTETDGSVTSPAALCGLVGMKPTVGVIPGAGIIPISHTQDTAGPMARTVRDAAALLSVLAGRDFTSTLDGDGLCGARIGVARKFFGNNSRVDALIEEAINVVALAGAYIVDPADLPTHGKYKEAELEVMLYEYKADLNAYLGSLPARAEVHSITDVILFNEKFRKTEMPFFGQEILIQAVNKGPLTEKAYLDALATAHRLTREEGIDAVLKQHHLDAIIAPTSGPAWLIDHINGDYDVGDCTSPAAIAGYPHITVPAGFVGGLPVGLSFFASANSDKRLLEIAFAYEQASKARRPPQFKRTAGA